MINKNKITLLDGGMGQELIHRSTNKPDTLWSARVLSDNYDLVVETHKDFIRSGVDAISLNSYAVTPQRLKRSNLEDMFLPLQKKAIKAANEAIISVSCIYFFYAILKILTNNIFSLITTLIYTLSSIPYILITFIGAEQLLFFFSMFFIYCLKKYDKSKKINANEI